MKKYILFLTSFLFLNTTYSQVLLDDNFDNYTLGNLGTDPDGVIPGQGGWLTECLYVPASKNNSRFTITTEPGRGKVLTISSFPPPQQYAMSFSAKKTGLNTLIDQRSSGNNVIKLEIDYYTGVQNQHSPLSNISLSSSDRALVNWIHRTGGGGSISVAYDNGKTWGHEVELSNLPILPFNTWVTFIAYLDYNNKKNYFETPYFGTVAVGDFLSQSNSNNLMQDFKPSAIHLRIGTTVYDTSQMVNKYDNIKITALNAVPPEVIVASTDDFLSQKFNLYPNPATDVVNITNSENMFVNQVVIYDITGKQLSRQTFNNQEEIQLNVENMVSGVYMLHIETNEGTAVKKLVRK